MNDLQVIDEQIAEIQNRAEFLNTVRGQSKASMRFIEIFAVLQSYGYKLPDVDKKLMARSWTIALGDYISLYGMEIIKEAVVSFAVNDKREYKSFPKPSELIQEIKSIGGDDPREVRNKIEYERLKERLYQESVEKLEKYRRDKNEHTTSIYDGRDKPRQ